MINSIYDPSFTDLSVPSPTVNIDAASAQQLADSTAQNDALNKQILAAYNPLQQVQAAAAIQKLQPDRPQFKTDVGPVHSIFEGVAKGLGNGINNIQALRDYGRQRQQVVQLGNLYQNAQAQQLGQIQQLQHSAALAKQQQGIQLGVLIDPASTPEAKRAALINLQGGGIDLASGVAKEVAGYQLAPDKGAAEGAETVAKDQATRNDARNRFHALAGIYPEQVFTQANKGLLTPQIQSAWQYAYPGQALPKDAGDLQERYAKIQQLGIQTQREQNNLDAQPTQLEQETRLRSLNISQEQAKAQYAEANAQYDHAAKKEDAYEVQQHRQRLDEGYKAYQAAAAKWDQLQPEQINLINAKFKSQGLKFELPEKKPTEYKPLSNKTTKLYNPSTGEIRQLGQ